MSGRGNPPRCRLQRADPAEMRRHPDGSAAIAANPTRNNPTQSPPLPLRSILPPNAPAPRIAGLPRNQIFRLIGHQKFRRIGIPNQNRSGCPQPRRKQRIARCHKIRAQPRTRRAIPSRHIDATLDGNRHAVQRTKESPRIAADSAALASRRAPCASTCTKAFNFGCIFSMRCKCASTTRREKASSAARLPHFPQCQQNKRNPCGLRQSLCGSDQHVKSQHVFIEQIARDEISIIYDAKHKVLHWVAAPVSNRASHSNAHFP